MIAHYKTVQTQLRGKYFKYVTGVKTDNTGEYEYAYIPKDLNWLHKPILFFHGQADLYRGRDYKRIKDGRWSLVTNGDRRILCHLVFKGFEKYLDDTWKFGVRKLVKHKSCWMFHIRIIKEIDESIDPKNVVGIRHLLINMKITRCLSLKISNMHSLRKAIEPKKCAMSFPTGRFFNWNSLGHTKRI